MEQIPRWLKGHLRQEDLPRIEQAVTVAETKTSGEIVPMLVGKSSSIGHVPAEIFLLVMLVLLGAVSTWNTDLLPLWSLQLLAVLIAVAATVVLKDIAAIQRFLTPHHDQVDSVMHRAQLEFFLSDIKQTKAHTGVLIFVSMLERRAVILADPKIAAEYPPETWTDVLQPLIAEIKKDRLAEGFCIAVAKCAEKLAPHFPATPHVNELPNNLVIKN